MKASAIRDRLRELGVPSDRAIWAANQYGDEESPTPTKRALQAIEREAKRIRIETERRKFKLWCKASSLPLPTFEHYFAKPERNYRFDVAWVEEQVALEINGGIWRKGGGAHTGRGHLRDMDKLNLAQKKGWQVAQFTPQQLYTVTMAETIREMLHQRETR